MENPSRRALFGGFKKPPAPIELSIRSCLAWNGTMCSSCLDSCHARAIKFFGVMRPTIDVSRCDLCGDCVPVCPVQSIIISEATEKMGV